MTRKSVSALIPLDELFWSEEQAQYIALSDDEINKIILDCYQNAGITELDEIHKVLNQFTQMKVDMLLYKRYMDDYISIDGLNKEGEVCFTPK